MNYFLRIPDVCQRVGKSKSAVYRDIGDGLLPPPVRIGKRASGFPDSEIAAVNHARLQGQSDDEIKRLVVDLVESRSSAAEAAA